jgi:hypothetical protein
MAGRPQPARLPAAPVVLLDVLDGYSNDAI